MYLNLSLKIRLDIKVHTLKYYLALKKLFKGIIIYYVIMLGQSNVFDSIYNKLHNLDYT